MDKLSYREVRQGRRFMIRVLPGTRLVDELLQFARLVELRHAAIVSAVGSVRDVEFSDIQAGARLPITEPRMPVHRVEGPLDLLGLEGNLVPNETGRVDAHLHIFAAKSSGEAIGGHLRDAEVFATCEVILSEYIVEGVERQHSTRGGVDTLFFEDK
ncbi:MAG TPA: PPC domain-containing DNA-binding protein [Vicinamibacterales bacterium]